MVPRRWRGVLGISLIWAAAWGILGSMFGGAIFLGGIAGVLPRLPFLTLLQGATVGWAVNGGLAGGLFAVHLMRTLRRRQHGTLTWRWAAVWGAVAGCVPPALGGAMAALAVVQVPVLQLGAAIAFCGALGATSASVTRWLARRPDPRMGADPVADMLTPGSSLGDGVGRVDVHERVPRDGGSA